MSKAVMLSIKPKYCDLIASGKKTIEVRKRAPKITPPFKCYIYCTKSNLHECLMQNAAGVQLIKCFNYKTAITCGGYVANGKVIGEFICDDIKWNGGQHLIVRDDVEKSLVGSCLTVEELGKYLGLHKGMIIYDHFGWHISELKIYDKPKGLNEFYRKCEKMQCEGCEHLKYQRVNSNEYDFDCEYFGYKIPITRPPQSWCYVEEM